VSRAARIRAASLGLSLVLAAALATPAGAAPPGSPLRASPQIPARFLAPLRARIDRSAGRSDAAFHPSIDLRARDGYEIRVMALGEAVVLEVTRRNGLTGTAYVARGTVKPNRLRASFGAYGHISVRFRPSKNRSWRKPHRRCRGRSRFVVRRGTYVGTIRFTGEGGYISLDAHRAPGTVGSVAPKCRHSRRSASPRPASASAAAGPPFLGRHTQLVIAGWRRAVSSETLLAIREGGIDLFFATTEQSEGQLAKLRFAFARWTRGVFVNDALTEARVSPPPPFTGTGIYAAAPDGTTSWTGTLTADFPGAPAVPFTGPPFGAEVGAGFE
jgi:hypothetical protein